MKIFRDKLIKLLWDMLKTQDKEISLLSEKVVTSTKQWRAKFWKMGVQTSRKIVKHLEFP
jgi:hypothetical protein